jgi:hypothetical protein
MKEHAFSPKQDSAEDTTLGFDEGSGYSRKKANPAVAATISPSAKRASLEILGEKP